MIDMPRHLKFSLASGLLLLTMHWLTGPSSQAVAQSLPLSGTEQMSSTGGNPDKLRAELGAAQKKLIEELKRAFNKSLAKVQAKALLYAKDDQPDKAREWTAYVQKMRQTQDLPEQVLKSDIGTAYMSEVKSANEKFSKVLETGAKRARKQNLKELSENLTLLRERIKKEPITFAMVHVASGTIRTPPSGPVSSVSDHVEPELIVDLAERGGLVAPERLDKTETQYLYIPLVGPFGESITAEGVDKSIRYAKSKGIKHIVFYLDSGGGYIRVAEKIQDVIKAHDAEMDFHVIIKNAISASIWVVFACDTVHMLPNGTVGGAVVYSQNRSTGNTQVDAKMNSIIAAQMEATAKAKGHPHLLARPMILMDAEVYAWDQGRGQVAMARIQPKGKSLLMGDDRRTVLTLTTDQAVAIGLARPLANLDQLGEQLGFSNFTPESTFGERAMKAAKLKAEAEAKKLKLMVDNLRRDWTALQVLIKQASEKNPKNGSYGTTEDGKFTRDGQISWVRNTDAAIKKWREAQRELRNVERAVNAIKRVQQSDQGLISIEVLEKLKVEIDNEIDTLKDNRRNTSRD